ncbi:MAG: Clp domain protein [Blastococcus sp.]|jgi:ATP-dependent Clp protease ATP-binding subunit ClpA|nr:Clp domain protein [Blastococcus sp.]
MFERFTQQARQIVEGAQGQARQLHSGRVGTEHLLLSLVAQAGSASADVLAAHGLTHDSVAESVRAYVGAGDLDADALTTLGIDLDAVRDRVEATFGPGALDGGPAGRNTGMIGHIPFTPRAKKVLELSLREAVALKSRTIADGHIALGLLREGEGLAMKVLADRGVDLEAVRRELRTALQA